LFLLVIAVKESVVNSLFILKKDNAQSSVFKFRNPSPSAKSTISLYFFMFRVRYDMLNPFVLDFCSVRPSARVLKVLCLRKWHLGWD